MKKRKQLCSLLILLLFIHIGRTYADATYSVTSYFNNPVLTDEQGNTYYEDSNFAYDVCMDLEKIPTSSEYSASLSLEFLNKNVVGQFAVYFPGSVEPAYRSEYVDEQLVTVEIVSVDGPTVNWNTSMVNLGIFTCTIVSTRPVAAITFEMQAQEFYDSVLVNLCDIFSQNAYGISIEISEISDSVDALQTQSDFVGSFDSLQEDLANLSFSDVESAIGWDYFVLIYLLVGMCGIFVILVSLIIAQQLFKRQLNERALEAVTSVTVMTQTPAPPVIPMDGLFQANVSSVAFQSSFREFANLQEAFRSPTNNASDIARDNQTLNTPDAYTTNPVDETRSTTLLDPLRYMFSLGKRGFWKLVIREHTSPSHSETPGESV